MYEKRKAIVLKMFSVLTSAVFVLLVVLLACGWAEEKTTTNDLVRIAQFNIWEIC